MRLAAALSVAVLALGLAAFAGVADRGSEPPASAPREGNVRDALQELSRRRVFFGHQSVGFNLVDGVERLAKAEGQPLAVAAVTGPAAVAPGTFAHAAVPKNGQPLMKLESFERALAELGEVDVALVKFCYVDVGPATDVRALFEAHEATLSRLEARYPNTTFVRVTVPLHTVQRGPKALVKRVLGKGSTGVAENARREELNELLRAAVARTRAPLFDLARVESTHPDGRVETEPWEGKPVRALVPAYTYDGGHLNDLGKERAARELVSVIAAAPLRGASARR